MTRRERVVSILGKPFGPRCLLVYAALVPVASPCMYFGAEFDIVWLLLLGFALSVPFLVCMLILEVFLVSMMAWMIFAVAVILPAMIVREVILRLVRRSRPPEAP